MNAFSPIPRPPARKVRSNKGKPRQPYAPRKSPSKCVRAFLAGNLLKSKLGNPYLLTQKKNRYSCKKQLNKKGMNYSTVKLKPTNKPSQFPKGTVRNGWVIKVIKKGAGTTKVWRRVN